MASTKERSEAELFRAADNHHLTEPVEQVVERSYVHAGQIGTEPIKETVERYQEVGDYGSNPSFLDETIEIITVHPLSVVSKALNTEAE